MLQKNFIFLLFALLSMNNVKSANYSIFQSGLNLLVNETGLTFPNIQSLLNSIISNDEETGLLLYTDIILNETMEVNLNISFIGFENIKWSFNNEGNIVISSKINFLMGNLNIGSFDKISNQNSIFNFDDAVQIIFKNCTFNNFSLNASKYLIYGTNLESLVLEFINLQIYTEGGQENEVISINNVTNFTIINFSVINSVFNETMLIKSLQSNNYFSDVFISDNQITQNNFISGFYFIEISNIFEGKNLNFINNSFNVPFFGVKTSFIDLNLNFVVISQNTIDSYGNDVPLIILTSGESCWFENFSIENNILSQNMIEISYVTTFTALNVSFIDNASKNVLYLQNLENLLLEFFSCIRNNNNNDIQEGLIETGACLRIMNTPLIFIDSSNVVNSSGNNAIPGFIITNFMDSNITITNSIFSGNIFNSTEQIIDFYGCSLYISSSPYVQIDNVYFTQNYVILAYATVGGPILYFTTSGASAVSITNSVIEENYSDQSSLIIEFSGQNLTISNCQFLNNMPYSSDSYNELIVNGLASIFTMTNCTIIGNTAYNGLYFLYEGTTKLTIIFDYVIIINNSGGTTVGFASQFETQNREILFSNSVFNNNTLNGGGGTFTYIYVYAYIVKFNFTIQDCSINFNYAPPDSYGILDFWTYSNNITFTLANSQMIGNIFPSLIPERCFISFMGIQELIKIDVLNTTISNSTTGNLFFYVFQSDVLILDSIFEENNHIGTESFFHTLQSNIEMKNVSIRNNTMAGLMFYFFGICIVDFEEIIVSFNSYKNYFIFSSDIAEFTMSSSQIMVNTAGDIEYFGKMQGGDNYSFENNSFIDNSGLYEVMFWFSDTEASFINMECVMTQNNQSQDFLVFSFASTTALIQNFSFNSENAGLANEIMVIESSLINIDNLSLILPLDRQFINVIAITKSTLSINNTDILDLMMESSNYFIYSFQSNINLEFFNMQNCQNLIYSTYSSVIISNSQFYNITTQSSEDEIIFLEKSYDILFQSSSFNALVSIKSPISILYSSMTNESLIFNCSFINNTALQNLGGALYVTNTAIIIDSCLFSLNQAVRGGGIYFECLLQDQNQCNFTIQNNIFVKNFANIDGGAYKFQYIQPLDINNTFLNNSAIYANNTSSFLCKLGLIVTMNNQTIFSSFESNSSDFFILEGIFSNIEIFDYTIKLYPLNTFNDIILETLDQNVNIDVLETINITNNTLINEKISEINVTNPFYCSENQNFRYVGKLTALQESDFTYLFNDFTIISCPTSLIYLQFTCNFDYSYPQNYYSLLNSLNEATENSYYLFMPVKIESCLIGQFYNPSLLLCQQCLEGYYSLINETLTCNSCPYNAFCPGGSEIVPLEYYWNDEAFSENIYSCNVFVDNCLGMNCSDGYEGVLCQNCIRIIENNVYYRDPLGNCTQCPNVYLILLCYAVIVGSIIYVVRFVFLRFQDESKSNLDKKFSIKMFINFIHLLIYTKNQYQDSSYYISYDFENILKHVKFYFKLEYVYVSFDCLYYLSDHTLNEYPFINDIFFILSFYFALLCYYLYLRIKKISTGMIINKFFLLSYMISPLLFIYLKDGVSFRIINEDNLLNNNTNFTFNDSIVTIAFFYFPNIMIISFILFLQNIFFVWKMTRNVNLKIKPHVICTLGLDTPLFFEVCNFGTMIFFFLVNVLEIENNVKNEVILFFYFYRIIFELQFCKFTNDVYKRINFFYKLIFFFDYLIIVFMTGNVYLMLVFPFLVIEVFLMVSFVFSLFVFYRNLKFFSFFRKHTRKYKNIGKIHGKELYIKNNNQMAMSTSTKKSIKEAQIEKN